MSQAQYWKELPGNISGNPAKTFFATREGNIVRNANLETVWHGGWGGAPMIEILSYPPGGAWYNCPNGGRYFLDWLPFPTGYTPPSPPKPPEDPDDPVPDDPDPPTPPDEPPIVPPSDPDDPEDPAPEDEKAFMRQEWEWVTIGYDKDGNHFLERKLVTQWYEKVATLEEGG